MLSFHWHVFVWSHKSCLLLHWHVLREKQLFVWCAQPFAIMEVPYRQFADQPQQACYYCGNESVTVSGCIRTRSREVYYVAVTVSGCIRTYRTAVQACVRCQARMRRFLGRTQSWSCCSLLMTKIRWVRGVNPWVRHLTVSLHDPGHAGFYLPFWAFHFWYIRWNVPFLRTVVHDAVLSHCVFMLNEL